MDKIYTQEDLDNIVAKAKENMRVKFERDFIPKTEYDALTNKHNELLSSGKKQQIKNEFLKRNGNDDAFEDFYNVSKEHLNNTDEKDLDKTFESLSTEKKWAFNQEDKSAQQFNANQSFTDPIINEMNGGTGVKNDELYEGTIYKINN